MDEPRREICPGCNGQPYTLVEKGYSQAVCGVCKGDGTVPQREPTHWRCCVHYMPLSQTHCDKCGNLRAGLSCGCPHCMNYVVNA